MFLRGVVEEDSLDGDQAIPGGGAINECLLGCRDIV